MGSSKAGGAGSASLKQSYEDFEPFCKWEKEESRHTLVLHLLEFKKQQLRVQVNNHRILTITGERPLDETRISRFRKEIKIPNNVNSKEVRAKFSCGILYVIIPLTSPSLPKENGKSKVDVNQDRGTENSPDQTGRQREKRVAARFRARSLVSRLRMGRVMTAKVAVTVALVAALGAYLGYELRSWTAK